MRETRNACSIQPCSNHRYTLQTRVQTAARYRGPRPLQDPCTFSLASHCHPLLFTGATSVKLWPVQPAVMIPLDRNTGAPLPPSPTSSTICGRSRDAKLAVVPLSHPNSGPYARLGSG